MSKIKIDIHPRTLHFKQPAGTSRGVYTLRQIWLLKVTSEAGPERVGWGECAPLPDLSCDALPDYGKLLRQACDMVEQSGEIPYDTLRPYPSMLFGIETAMLSFERGGTMLFDTAFGRGEIGIPINGLVWMGTIDEMLSRMQEKTEAGFRCIKLKIGALNFDKELEMVRQLRRSFPKDKIEIRLDANGGFSADNALQRLERLARYDVHSIEQPIRQKQLSEMARLCKESPIDIALDEELIGINDPMLKADLLDTIKPQYIILKPSLHGGMKGSSEWIAMARERGIGSWITSALESNIGLNAIAHFTARAYGDQITMPQGLGTGMLFTDNITMPLEIRGDELWHGA